jgi:uncharacterized protein YjbJ (UPF0337 family)
MPWTRTGFKESDLLTDQCQPCHVAPQLLDDVHRHGCALRRPQICQTHRNSAVASGSSFFNGWRCHPFGKRCGVTRALETGQRQGEREVGKLTDDDLDVINGRRDQLEGKIQERYGIAKDQTRKDIDGWYTAQKW